MDLPQGLKGKCLSFIASNPNAYNLSTLPEELSSTIATLALNNKLCDILYLFLNKFTEIPHKIIAELALSPSHYKKLGALLKNTNFAVLYLISLLINRLFMIEV